VAEFTIKVIPLSQRTDAVDCSACGVLDLQPHDTVDQFVHNHLFGFHHCDPDTTEFRST
jgi:hypothetical protein